MNFKRTDKIGNLTLADEGRKIRLSGWVHRRRDLGHLIFIDIRDRYGICQLIFDPEISKDSHRQAEKLHAEDVISIEGTVLKRKEANKKIKTGEIEVQVYKIDLLSAAKTPPFSISEDLEINEELRLKYRYLDIRRGTIVKNLEIRHKAMLTARNFFDKEGFLEITTPILSKTTPEGARDYLVPSRIYAGNFYALPQSPQIFKQILMISGMDRYFQIAQCFRDEDLRADRQPEFTQIDLEMSFSTPDELFPIIENLFKNIFSDCLKVEIPHQFPHMSYKEALEKYGTDKPDLRFEMAFSRLDDLIEKTNFSLLKDLLKKGEIIKGFVVKKGAGYSRKRLDELQAFVKKFKMEGLFFIKKKEDSLQSNILKFFTEDQIQELEDRLHPENHDLIILGAAKESVLNQSFDQLRRKIAKEENLINPDTFKFLWVTDFPMFSSDEEGNLKAEHHPFTSPYFEDIPLMDKDPLKVRALAYDLVLNGYELASGSQRIHDSELQEKIFKILNLSKEDIEIKFGYFIEALKYGVPPHLGCALGLDRLIMILTKTDNIRDVIAFPKTQKACDLMMQAPSYASEEQKNELHLKNTDFDEIHWH